jgi:hypothetical protein
LLPVAGNWVEIVLPLVERFAANVAQLVPGTRAEAA